MERSPAFGDLGNEATE